MSRPIPGFCRACGRALVHVPGERTYHPATVLGPGDTCPALLPIPGTDTLSGNVPDHQFVTDAERESCTHAILSTETHAAIQQAERDFRATPSVENRAAYVAAIESVKSCIIPAPHPPPHRTEDGQEWGGPEDDHDVDLLEDPDGAPYPDAVQSFVRNHEPIESGDGLDWREELVTALEAVAAAAWDDGEGEGYSSGYHTESSETHPNPERAENPHTREDRGTSSLGRVVEALEP